MFDLKAFLDKNLFHSLLAGWQHQLSIITFLLGNKELDSAGVGVVLVFMLSKSFAEDILGVLGHGGKLDYFRYPTPVGEYVFFGSDGMPGISGTGEYGSGMARARLLVTGSPQLIIEIRQRGTAGESVKAVQEFYDTAKERLGLDADGLMKTYGAGGKNVSERQTGSATGNGAAGEPGTSK